MVKTFARHCIFALVFCAFAPGVATARSAYDGWWNLTFVTQRGACDAAYRFTVQVRNGIVSHPNLVRFKGRVARGGAVRASVTAGDKHAAGTGRLSGRTGHGRWAGHSGSARCSGAWTAQRT